MNQTLIMSGTDSKNNHQFQSEPVNDKSITKKTKLAKIKLDIRSEQGRVRGLVYIPSVDREVKFYDKYGGYAYLKDQYLGGAISYELWIEWTHDVERSALPYDGLGEVYIFQNGILQEFHSHYKSMDELTENDL